MLNGAQAKWTCSCGVSNASHRRRCYQCGEKGKGRLQRECWLCSECGCPDTYASRTSCHRCGEPRPDLRESGPPAQQQWVPPVQQPWRPPTQQQWMSPVQQQQWAPPPGQQGQQEAASYVASGGRPRWAHTPAPRGGSNVPAPRTPQSPSQQRGSRSPTLGQRVAAQRAQESPEQVLHKQRLAEIDAQLAGAANLASVQGMDAIIADLKAQKEKLVAQMREEKPAQVQLRIAQKSLDDAVLAHTNLGKDIDVLEAQLSEKKGLFTQQQEPIRGLHAQVAELSRRAKQETVEALEKLGCAALDADEVQQGQQPQQKEQQHAPLSPVQWALGFQTAIGKKSPVMAERFQAWMDGQTMEEESSCTASASAPAQQQEPMETEWPDAELQANLRGAMSEVAAAHLGPSPEEVFIADSDEDKQEAGHGVAVFQQAKPARGRHKAAAEAAQMHRVHGSSASGTAAKGQGGPPQQRT